MNYKKTGMIGLFCAMGALAPQKTNANTVYIIEEPAYTTQSVVYETVPTTYVQAPVTYGTGATIIQQPIATSSVLYTQPVVYPTVYTGTYYDGYYDAMNRRWWYNNNWCYTRPSVRYSPRTYGGYCGRYSAPLHHYNRCVPAPRYNHCAPVVRPHINHCAPRGGFHHGGGPRGRCR